MGCDEGASSQHLDLLSMTGFSAGIDHFLLSFKELLGEVSELKDFSFNERVSQSLYSMVDKLLVRLPILKDSLPKGMEWGLSAISRLSSQLDRKNRMSLFHGEKGSGVCIVEHESHVLGLAAIVIGVMYEGRNAELSI